MTRNHPVYKGRRAFHSETTTLAKIQESVRTWERQIAESCWKPRYKRQGGRNMMLRIEVSSNIFVELGSQEP